MADEKKIISQLPDSLTAQGTDIFIVNQGTTTRKETRDKLRADVKAQVLAGSGQPGGIAVLNQFGKLPASTETDPVWLAEKSSYYTKAQSDAKYIAINPASISINTEDNSEAVNVGGVVMFNMGGSILEPITAPPWGLKWSANTDNARIFMESTGDLDGSSNLVFELSDNRTGAGGPKEGFKFRKSGTGDTPPQPDFDLLHIKEEATVLRTKLLLEGDLNVSTMADTGSDTTGRIRLSGGNPSNYGWMGFYRANGTRDGYIGSSPYGRLDFISENGSVFLFQGGNVGFGETIPLAPVHIKGVSTTTGNALKVDNSASTALLEVANNGDLTFMSLKIIAGSGSPEGAVSAPVGSLYLRKDGGASTVFYVKETGTGNTGWISK